MPKRTNLAGINGVNGLGHDYFEDSILQSENNNGEYAEHGGMFSGGLEVTENIKNQLESQPASKFLYFEKTNDDKYVANFRLPERGARTVPNYEYTLDEEGKISSFEVKGNKTYTFDIRKNVNYIYKAVAKGFINEDGKVDLKKGLDALSDMGDMVSHEFHDLDEMTNSPSNRSKMDIINHEKGLNDVAEYIIKTAEVPEEDKESVRDFCRAGLLRNGFTVNKENPELFNTKFFDDIEAYVRGNVVTAINMSNDSKYNTPEYNNLKADCSKAIRKFEEDIRNLSNIDAKNQYKFVNPITSSYMSNFFITSEKLSNDLEGKTDLVVSGVDVKKNSTAGGKTENPEKEFVESHAAHNVICLPFELDGKKCLVTIDGDAKGTYEQSVDFKGINQTYLGIYELGAGEPQKFEEKEFKKDIQERAAINLFNKYEVKRGTVEKATLQGLIIKLKESLRAEEEAKETPEAKEAREKEGKPFTLDEKLGKDLEARVKADYKIEYQKALESAKEFVEAGYKLKKQNENITNYFEKGPSKVVETKEIDARFDKDISYNVLDGIDYTLKSDRVINDAWIQNKQGLEVFDVFFDIRNKDSLNYAKALDKLYINGSKATTIFDLDDISKLSKEEVENKLYIAAASLKEMSADNMDPNGRKNHFAVENKNGELEPIYEQELPEVKRAEKPSRAYKMFHSKEKYDAKMKAWQEYTEYKKNNDEIKSFNDDVKKFYGELNKYRKDIKAEMAAKAKENEIPENKYDGKVKSQELNVDKVLDKNGKEFLKGFLGVESDKELTAELDKLYLNGARANNVLGFDGVASDEKFEKIGNEIKNMLNQNLDSKSMTTVDFQREKDGELYAVTYTCDVIEIDKKVKTTAYEYFKQEQKMEYIKTKADYKEKNGVEMPEDEKKALRDSLKAKYKEANNAYNDFYKTKADMLNQIKACNAKNLDKTNIFNENNLVGYNNQQREKDKDKVKSVNLNDLTGKQKKDNAVEKVTKPVSMEKQKEADKQMAPAQKKNP